MATQHVLLPTEDGRDLIGAVPAEVEVGVWNGTGDLPEAARATGFWVPPFLSGSQLSSAMTQMSDLQVVQLLSAGADAYVGRVPEHVMLCDARGVHTSSTSEWVLAVLLASLRDIPRFVRAQEARKWDQSRTDELAGKRALIVGAGAIGDGVRSRLVPFEVDVTMVARTPRDGVHSVDELPALLPDADIVVVIVPLTDATRGLADAKFFAAMRDGALFINGARGPVADTEALAAEVLSGRLRAALDVTDPEPLPAEHPLWDAEGLLLTPHVGGAVPGFPRRAFGLVGEQIRRWAAGEPLINAVVNGY
jgi:phosphoglycerate dehydrogenase-like enzyme